MAYIIHQRCGFAYKTWQFGSREHLDLVVFSRICTRVTMRSIIVCLYCRTRDGGAHPSSMPKTVDSEATST
jgi:hypothetical protein